MQNLVNSIKFYDNSFSFQQRLLTIHYTSRILYIYIELINGAKFKSRKFCFALCIHRSFPLTIFTNPHKSLGKLPAILQFANPIIQIQIQSIYINTHTLTHLDKRRWRAATGRRRTTRLPLQAGGDRRFRRRKIESAVAIRSQRVLLGLQVHHRRRIRHAQHSRR